MQRIQTRMSYGKHVQYYILPSITFLVTHDNLKMTLVNSYADIYFTYSQLQSESTEIYYHKSDE